MEEKYTKKRAEEDLNEIGCPVDDHPEAGGRVPWNMVDRYGTWLRRNDPVAFEVFYQENFRALERHVRSKH